MKRTSLILDADLIAEAMRLTGAKTKTQVVDLALRELVKSVQRRKLQEELGSYKLTLTPEELQRLRRGE